jgi:cytochrome c
MSAAEGRGRAPARAVRRVGFALLAFPSMAIAEPSSLAALSAQGHDLVRANCSRCHAVEIVGDSPNRRAPPFRTLSGRYVELTLHRRLTEIAETGHYDMPPMPVHSDEVQAIVSYINSLPAPADPGRRP